MNKTKNKSIFDEFTRKYSLSKTLRFELKPIGKTEDFIKKNKVLEKDKVIDMSYQQAKPYFDKLHQEFIEEALNLKWAQELSLREFEIAWKKLHSGKDKGKSKSKGEFEKQKKEFYKQIVSLLDSYADEWKERYAPDAKKSGTKLLHSAEILPILKVKFPAEDNEENLFITNEDGKRHYIFDSFDGFTTYLGKFQETRANLYKGDGTATAIATRVGENLEFFLQNRECFEKYKQHKKQLKLSAEEEKIGDISFYTDCLTQSGIEIYNKMAGDLNYRMKQLQDSAGKNAKKKDYPLLKKLYNQILAEKEIEADEYELESMEDALPKFDSFAKEVERVLGIAKELTNCLARKNYANDYEGIYLHNRAINTLARRWFISTYEFESALPQKGRSKEGNVKIASFVSFADIEEALKGKSTGETFKERIIEGHKLNEEASAFSQFLQLFSSELTRLKREYREDFKVLKSKKLKKFARGKNDENVKVLKATLDGGLRIIQLMKYFVLSTKKADKKPVHTNSEFYNSYDELYGDPNQKHPIVRYYDSFRNFLSKKPSDEDKIRLNFDSGLLLSGFDKNKEPEKLGVIFRKEDDYYLGIINKESNKIFDDKKHADVFDVKEDGVYEKMEYKLFPDSKRMVPKIAFAKKNREVFGWTKEIQKIKDEYAAFQENKKGDKSKWNKRFNKKKLSKLIAYYQNALEKGGYRETFKFEWKKPIDYKGVGEFNAGLDKQNYRVDFRKMSDAYVNEKVAQGELYLFKIYNKDFAKKAEGKKNIYTLYFLNLFSEANLENSILRLAGNAEVFYRQSSIKKEKEKRNFPRSVVRYKRYTENKYFFHVPIVINANVDPVSRFQFNNELNEQPVATRDSQHIIGIDRGEKHLAYYTVINQEGKILKQGSLNEINGVNYFKKLRDREKERREQRQSWQSVAQIKDLKRGYISQVVHKLAKLVVDHNAVIVFEDLNMRFKQKRGGIERSVYQQLEKAVIDKFGYLVFKEKDLLGPGGILNGYQLTAPFESFKKMGKQNGIILYTDAAYTSITDPVTGWRQHIYIRSGTKNEDMLALFTKKVAVDWNDKAQSYTFTYDQKDFFKELPNRKWILHADVPRIERYRNNAGYWDTREANPNALLKELFTVWKFDKLEEDMSEQIAAMYEGGQLKGERAVNEKKQSFFKALRYILNLIQQIRNSDPLRLVYERDEQGNIKYDDNDKALVKEIGKDVDFIASPVKPFFSTKNPYRKENICGLNIENGDANGAYNIARKGVLILQRIKENPERPDLYIKKSDWDKFAQKQK